MIDKLLYGNPQYKITSYGTIRHNVICMVINMPFYLVNGLKMDKNLLQDQGEKMSELDINIMEKNMIQNR